MKALRVIGNVIIGIILFALLFALIITSRARDLVENDLLYETVKTSVSDVSKDEIKDSQNKLVEEMFGDSEAGGIIRMILDNYREYRDNPNYKVSEKDAKRLYDFVLKYKNQIEEISDRKVNTMTDEEFEEFFNYDKINEFAKDGFKEFDKNIDNKTIRVALDAYTIATSTAMKTLLVVLIIFFIGLLILINWSIIKWMLVFGIDLIVSGLLTTIIFIAGSFIKEMIDLSNVKLTLNLNGFLIAGIIQFVLGLILIIVYSILKNKFFNNKEEIVKKEPVKEIKEDKVKEE